MPVSGLDLKVKRVRANVDQKAIAKAMGKSRATVWKIELSAAPDTEEVEAYLLAIETCRNVKTDDAA